MDESAAAKYAYGNHSATLNPDHQGLLRLVRRGSLDEDPPKKLIHRQLTN